MISLNKLVQDQTARKNTKKGFEPIEKVTINSKPYIFGIPFIIHHLEDNRIKVSFPTSVMDGILPHFKVLDKKAYALTTAYDNIIEVKKKIRSSLPQVIGALEITEKQVSKAGFLMKDKGALAIVPQLTLDLDIEKTITVEQATETRERHNITNFSEMEKVGLIDIIKKHKIKLPKSLEDKRGILVSVVIEIMSRLIEGQESLAPEQKKAIQEYLKNFK